MGHGVVMSDFIYRLAYVVICVAGLLAFWFAARWLIYGVSDDFGLGVGVGALIGFSFAAAAALIDKRTAAQRSERSKR